MTERKLIEISKLNSLLKAIEVHLNLLEQTPIYIQDSFYKEKIVDSVSHLKAAAENIFPENKDLCEMKRRAYFRYSQAKNELNELKKNNADIQLIYDKEEDVSKCLSLYKALKDAAGSSK